MQKRADWHVEKGDGMQRRENRNSEDSNDMRMRASYHVEEG